MLCCAVLCSAMTHRDAMLLRCNSLFYTIPFHVIVRPHYTILHYTTPHHTTPIRAHTTLHWTNAEANANVIASVSASHAMVHARVDALADVQG